MIFLHKPDIDPVGAQHVFPINLREEPSGIGMPYRLEDLDFGNVGFCYFHNSWCPRWLAFMFIQSHPTA
jgi:hypothetical protein